MVKRERKQQVHVRMSSELYRAVAARAKQEERSITAVIERALRDAFIAEATRGTR